MFELIFVSYFRRNFTRYWYYVYDGTRGNRNRVSGHAGLRYDGRCV